MSTKVVVRHFHEGNDADRTVRGIATYATVAKVVDLVTGQNVTPEVWAFCNANDSPTRAQGSSIAIGRLQKQHPKECSEAAFGVFEKLRVKQS